MSLSVTVYTTSCRITLFSSLGSSFNTGISLTVTAHIISGLGNVSQEFQEIALNEMKPLWDESKHLMWSQKPMRIEKNEVFSSTVSFYHVTPVHSGILITINVFTNLKKHTSGLTTVWKWVTFFTPWLGGVQITFEQRKQIVMDYNKL